jgi:hypothetical protein
MELKEPQAVSSTPPVPAAAPARRRRVSIVLYVLAACGLLALGLIGLAVYQAKTAPKVPERVVIDEKTVVESVMTETYGKYSATKKGWLYATDDNQTYLMRVVQQAKIGDGADGDELYFIASGTAINGEENGLYGVFHVYPTKPRDGGLTQTNMQVHYASKLPIKPEDVHFEALSETLWGWVVKVPTGSDPLAWPVSVANRVYAPKDGEIALLGEFKAALDFDPGMPCAEAKANWDALVKRVETVREEDGEHIDEALEEPSRCQKLRWTYRTGTVNGTTPVPITVTAGGTEDGLPVEPKKYKLMFDTKSFTYNVPEELQ